jgi:hypothetical protein
MGPDSGVANEVSTSGLADTKQSRPAKRREWPEGLKRHLVAETLEAGSSVSIGARRHDVNANQPFKSRREPLPQELRAVACGAFFTARMRNPFARSGGPAGLPVVTSSSGSAALDYGEGIRHLITIRLRSRGTSHSFQFT